MTAAEYPDVIVVGAGMTGAATAAVVAARGGRAVILEKETGPAREGSGRAQGSLRVQGRHGSELPIAQRALELWRAAAEEGDDFELVCGGNLYFRTREEELPILEGLVTEAHQAGLSEVQLLDAAGVRDIMPAASGPFLGAMWSPVDAHCQPEKGTRHFIDRALRLGAEVRYGIKVLGLLTSGDRVTGVETTAGPIRAGAVVLAAGVWTPYLTRTVGTRIPIMPVVMSELETEPVEPLFAQTIRAFGFGARQRPNGQVVVSAGLDARVMHGISLSDLDGARFWLPRAAQFRKSLKLGVDLPRIKEQLRLRSISSPHLVPDVSPEPPVDAPLVDASLARLQRVVPRLTGARVTRRWGGLIDMTPDGLPVIDGAAGPSGLTVVTGLCGHGFTLGPALGEIAADLAMDGRTAYDLADFRVARFAEAGVARPAMMI